MTARVQAYLTGACGLFLVAHWILGDAWLAYVSVAAGSVFAIQEAWDTLREKRVDVHVLMLFAAVGAVALGHPAEGAMLLFLFSLGESLESMAMGKTKSAIEGLIALRPDTATRIVEGQEEEVSVSELGVGDLVRISPFEQIPVDGEVVSGETEVNQVAMTGESAPVAKHLGDELLAGTQNQGGLVTMKVIRPSGETVLDKVVHLVSDAQENKASGEKVSQWFGQKYTFFVFFAFAASLGIRLVVGQEWGAAAYASLTLLVALSPCALVISVPASTLSALAWSARNGVLVRGGQYIEEIGRVDTATMDKTGTLTEGRPVLEEICVCTSEPESGQPCKDDEMCWAGGGMSPVAKKFLRFAAVAEQYSDHPIAAAIVRAAEAEGLEIPDVEDNEVVPGMGIKASLEGVKIKVGQVRFFEDLPKGFQAHADELRQKGMTVAIGEFDGEYAAFGLRDGLRKESKAAVEELRAVGVDRVVMLTGDNLETAAAIAPQAGVTEFQAGLFPEDKERIVGEMVDSGRRVVMVGDGINDAPALARANVGVAMGGLGSDIALNAADIVLMHDKIEELPRIIRLGKKANRVIWGNLVFAGGVMAVLSLLTVVLDIWAPALHDLLLPMAVIGHEGSTVLVILNGLRLLRGP